mgnify:CR=1 FL=1
MKKILLIFLISISILNAYGDQFWSDLEQVYLNNVKNQDKDCKASISRIRKLFYDGKSWNVLIPDAKKYEKPTDAISVQFKKNYGRTILIKGKNEDFKHLLAGLDSYLHPKKINVVFQKIFNTDLCTWLGDTASALAEAYKQNIPLEKAFSNYANQTDLRANIGAYNIARLAKNYINNTYEFPIVQICQQHYDEWNNLAQRQKFLKQYFSSFKLEILKNSFGKWEFTKQSRKVFIKEYLGKIKIAAYAYYLSNHKKIVFKDKDCKTIFLIFLSKMEEFYNNY